MPLLKKIYCPENYAAGKKLAKRYRQAGAMIISLEKVGSREEGRQIKDYFLGMTYALKGFAFQCGKLLLFSFLKKSELRDCRQLRGWSW